MISIASATQRERESESRNSVLKGRLKILLTQSDDNLLGSVFSHSLQISSHHHIDAQGNLEDMKSAPEIQVNILIRPNPHPLFCDS